MGGKEEREQLQNATKSRKERMLVSIRRVVAGMRNGKILDIFPK